MTDLPMSIAELQAFSETKMHKVQRKFVARGVAANWTRDRNRQKLDEIGVVPRALIDVSVRDLATTVLGDEINFPIMCAPAGGQTGSHPDGEIAVAHAAGAVGTLMALPVGSAYTIEEVGAAATGPIWFQHIHYSDELTEDFLPRLKPAGFTALILTVDAVGPFPMTDDLGETMSPGLRSFGSFLHRPDLLDEHGVTPWVGPNLTWDRLDWLRELAGGLPLVLKGIRNVEDATRARDHKVEGIVVSNHGGRQFDGGISSIELMPRIVEAVGSDVEIYFDSGIRSGLDVYRAMALGAKAVFVGRPVHWGLAYGGAEGVRRMLNILGSEFDKVMAYTGCTSVDQIVRTNLILPGN